MKLLDKSDYHEDCTAICPTIAPESCVYRRATSAQSHPRC